MVEWNSQTLDDVIELQRGHDLPATTRGEGNVPVIGSFGITGYHDVARYPGPGVAIGRSGASIGVATYCPSPYWPLNTCLFVKDFRGNDPRWVYYLLDSIDFSGFNSGSAQPSLNRNYLKGIPVPTPPLAEQRSIAGMLGALDDKVESNRRIVAASMKLSESAFLQWRSTLEAEELTTFGTFGEVFGGATPSTSEPEYWGGDHVWVAPRDVTALDSVYLFDSERHITDLGLARSSTTLHPPGSIFMTSRATIGAFAINQVPCAPNQGFIVVRPRDPATRWFLFHEMKSRVVEMQDRATGSTFRELSRGSFREMTLSIPADREFFVAFEEAAAPVHARAAAAARESQSLTAFRDALLPELLSGRLRVREAEEMVGSV